VDHFKKKGSLLRTSFQSGRDIAELGIYLRACEWHTDYAASHIQLMQKVLKLFIWRKIKSAKNGRCQSEIGKQH